MQIAMRSFRKFGLLFLSFFVLNTFLLNAQIRLVEVRPAADIVTIKNFGSSTVNISDYWFCSLFAYPQLQSLNINSGALNLAPNATVTLSGFAINDSDGDMGLYLPINSNADFADQNFMVDFMQWGDANNGRESVAVAKGIWENDAFLPGSGPFVYNGDGTQNGIEAWGEGTLSVNDLFLNDALAIYPNPTNDVISIKKNQDINLKKVVLYDMSGSVVTSGDFNKGFSEDISLKSFSGGVYTLMLSDDKGRMLIKKIIKQ